MATVKELRAIAKVNGIAGYSKMNKAELEVAIKDVVSEIEVVDNSGNIYKHITTPADGEGLISITYGALIACTLHIITENELDRLEMLLSQCRDIEDMLSNRELMRIISKIPKVFQARHKFNGVKGTLIVAPLEFIPETKGMDVIITKGLSKYGNAEWGATDLEICAYLKRKSGWVNLNVQFINALVKYENPSFLTPIVDYWHNFAMSTLTNDIARLKFHNIVSSFGEEKNDNDLRLATVLKTNMSLKNERYVMKLASEQYDKFYTNLMCGRLPVPGVYSYMVTDPFYIVNQLFGANMPELKAGEYWCNGRTCEAGLFRSPMIAPFEAQKVQLVSHEFFDVFYKDITIFNGHDGIWELMGGADFDGDTCACLYGDEELSNIVVSAIKDRDYVILHESRSAQEAHYDVETFWADLAKYNSTVARPDRTGLITNHATKAIEIWHHLKACMYYGKKNGCNGIYMIHPNKCRKDENGNIINEKAHVVEVNGEKYMSMRGFVYANQDTDGKWVEEYPTGIWSWEQIEDLMKKFMLKVEYLNPVQGDEIDGAKTGFYPELFKAIEIVYQSEQTSARNEAVGKVVSKTAKKNSYISYSPLGIVYMYAKAKYEEFQNTVKDTVSDKTAFLLNLLSDEERKALDTLVSVNGENMSLVDYIKIRRTEYGKKMFAIINSQLDDEEKVREFVALREGADVLINGETVHQNGEIEELRNLASLLNISEESIAVACYIATNERNSNNNSSLSYGWLLFDEILSIFARANSQTTLYRMPAYTEEVSIKNGDLFVNGKKFAEVDAVDADYVPVQNISGRLFALVKMNKEAEVVVGKATVGTVMSTGVLKGFKYNGETVESFKEAFNRNKRELFINYGKENDVCVYIDGKLYCRMESIDVASRNIGDLVGHTVTVEISPNYKEYPGGIKNLMVRVVK